MLCCTFNLRDVNLTKLWSVKIFCLQTGLSSKEISRFFSFGDWAGIFLSKSASDAFWPGWCQHFYLGGAQLLISVLTQGLQKQLMSAGQLAVAHQSLLLLSNGDKLDCFSTSRCRAGHACWSKLRYFCVQNMWFWVQTWTLGCTRCTARTSRCNVPYGARHKDGDVDGESPTYFPTTSTRAGCVKAQSN